MVGLLRDVLTTHPGLTEVRLRLLTREATKVMRLDDRLRVTPTPALFADLKQAPWGRDVWPGAQPATTPEPTEPADADRPDAPSFQERWVPSLVQAAIVVVVLAAAGALGGWLWHHLYDVPQGVAIHKQWIGLDDDYRDLFGPARRSSPSSPASAGSCSACCSRYSSTATRRSPSPRSWSARSWPPGS